VTGACSRFRAEIAPEVLPGQTNEVLGCWSQISATEIDHPHDPFVDQPVAWLPVAVSRDHLRSFTGPRAHFEADPLVDLCSKLRVSAQPFGRTALETRSSNSSDTRSWRLCFRR
jgi:hypothetical protein